MTMEMQSIQASHASNNWQANYNMTNQSFSAQFINSPTPQTSPLTISNRPLPLLVDPKSQSSQPLSMTNRSISNESRPEHWRNKGYPAFSRWMASDEDFFVVRRFGPLSARVILRLQDRIQELSETLEAEDEECRKERMHSGQVRDCHPNDRRLQLLDEIAWRLEKYNQLVLSHSQMQARPDATEHQVNNVKNWLGNNETAIRDNESKFINEEGDLIPMVPRRKVPLRRWVEKFDFITEMKIFRKRKPNGSLEETTIYKRDERIDKVVTVTVISFGVAMLIGPLWWLQEGMDEGYSRKALLGVITGFIGVFTFLLGTVTVAQPFEVLAATAAYTAVLMVFLQITGGSPG